MTVPTREEALTDLDSIDAMFEALNSSVCDEHISRLRSYIESHTGEAVCPRSANGRPESFTVRECVAAGECGCGESVTPGSTVRASPVQLVLEWPQARPNELWVNEMPVGRVRQEKAAPADPDGGLWWSVLLGSETGPIGGIEAAKETTGQRARQWLGLMASGDRNVTWKTTTNAVPPARNFTLRCRNWKLNMERAPARILQKGRPF